MMIYEAWRKLMKDSARCTGYTPQEATAHYTPSQLLRTVMDDAQYTSVIGDAGDEDADSLTLEEWEAIAKGAVEIVQLARVVNAYILSNGDYWPIEFHQTLI